MILFAAALPFGYAYVREHKTRFIPAYGGPIFDVPSGRLPDVA